jgi:hypothetical protein
MRRVLACLLTLSIVLGAGCGHYKARMEATVQHLHYLKRLNDNLIEPPQAKFKELQIYVRPPKPLAEAKESNLQNVPAGQYDLAETFLGEPAKAEGETKDATAPADPNAVLRLHVLARVKRPKKTPKKGEAPPPDTSGRGEFLSDVKTLLAAEFSAGEEVTNTRPQDDTKGKNKFKRMIFKAPVSGDAIRVYFYKQGDYDVALVWDVPPAFEKSSASGINLCLECFAVGPKAASFFNNGYSDESMPGAPGGTGKGGPAAF